MTPEQMERLDTVQRLVQVNAKATQEIGVSLRILSQAIQQMESGLHDVTIRARLSTFFAGLLFAEIARQTGNGRDALEKILANLEGAPIRVFDHVACGDEVRAIVTEIVNEIVETAEALAI